MSDEALADTLADQQVRLDFEVALNYVVKSAYADFVFNIHAAQTDYQTVVSEQLIINQTVEHVLETDAVGNRWLRLRAGQGPLQVTYSATVNLTHAVAEPEQIDEVAIADIPLPVLTYLRASRYCQSDRLQRLALNEFGAIPPGYPRVRAVQDWVQKRVLFRAQASDVSTSAMDTLVEQIGVCRDFAHLMIALCRALNIPARFVTGIDYGADPALGPIDFHAYAEAFLSGRWYIFDASGLAIPMGFVRFGTGRDAADVAFATMFGDVQANIPVLKISAHDDSSQSVVVPFHTNQLLSTSAF